MRDTLVLMRRAAETRVDLDVGRELALRDGGIRVLISSRLDRLGSRLRLSASIVDPGDGRIVASDTRTVNHETLIVHAVVARATWIRRTLGEVQTELPPPAALQRATTESLAALQLYSKAYDLVAEQRQWAPAVKLLETAIQHDPRFASAHILLAWARFYTAGVVCPR